MYSEATRTTVTGIWLVLKNTEVSLILQLEYFTASRWK